jgi:hypothetical protein
MDVSYGANGTFTSPRTFTGGVDCNNSAFGDPVPGTVKWCEIRAVSATAPSNTQSPVISGDPSAGQTLQASQGSWSGSPTSFAYAWSRCDPNKANCTPITNATSSSYLVTSTDTGSRLIVTVIASNAAGSAVANSLTTAIVKK